MSGASVAAVVIGRNEGARLLRCLAALEGRAAPIVYVDSGSTDGSVAAARAAGARVVELDMSRPFTAARARNEGVAALGADAPDFVQFVDGDCEVDPGWIATARAFLDAHPDVAVACGRRRERFPGASVYNRLCDMEWDTPVGEAGACGGDSLMRLGAFRAVGGFDPSLIAGEEPDLCLRLQRAGWRVWRLDAEMTRHDAAITRFGQWWRRTMRGGWAFAEGAARLGAGPERYNLREVRGVLVWGGVVPAMAIGALAAAAAGAGGAALAAAAALAALYPLMVLRIARRRAQSGDAWRDALLYGVFVMLGKPAEFLGAARYAWRRLRGGAATLIEYKSAGA